MTEEHQPVRRRSNTVTTDDMNQIRASIENLSNRMMDEFNRVRNDMQLSMQNYTLNAVHQKDLERLNDMDSKQQIQIDAMQERINGIWVRTVQIVSGALAIIATLLTVLHILHVI